MGPAEAQRGKGPFVVTGYSGSGKTVLTRGLEDIGYHCVDNVPLDLVESVFEAWRGDLSHLVVVLDVRTPGFAERFPALLPELRRRFAGTRLVFVEASPDTLVHRYSVTRRPHPLAGPSLDASVELEVAALQPIRALADVVIDTTHTEPMDLRRQALVLGGLEDPRRLMLLGVQSFSYLYGVPNDASLVFDVRFLPNPYWVAELRPLAGDDAEVVRWLEGHAEVREWVDRICSFVLDLIPRYADELKARLTVAVGCTGGRHRSVFVAGRIAERIASAGYRVALHHRDRDRWRG